MFYVITKKFHHGFSLIELIICLALIAGLGSGCAIGLNYWQAYTQMDVQLEQMRQDILLSQQHARAAGTEVVLCPSKSGQSCGVDWSVGRMAYIMQAGEHKKLFFHRLRLKKAYWRWQSSLGKNERLIFKPTGDNLGQQGSFYYCPLYFKESFIRRLIINQLGRVYERSGQTNDC